MNLAYEEIVEFIASGTTPQSVVDFQPSPTAKARVFELLARQKTGVLTEDEEAELDQFIQLEHVMRLAKARARQRLNAG